MSGGGRLGDGLHGIIFLRRIVIGNNEHARGHSHADKSAVEEINDFKISKEVKAYKLYTIEKEGIEAFKLLKYISEKNKMVSEKDGLSNKLIHYQIIEEMQRSGFLGDKSISCPGGSTFSGIVEANFTAPSSAIKKLVLVLPKSTIIAVLFCCDGKRALAID